MQYVAPIAFLDEDGDIRVNFGMFAGREATRAEIDELAKALLDEVDAITIVAEQRTIADREMEASVHQIRVELDEDDPQRPLLIAEQWAEACVAEATFTIRLGRRSRAGLRCRRRRCRPKAGQKARTRR